MENTQLQFQNPRPPRISQGFQLTVDGTARIYDLTGLNWGEEAMRLGEIGQSLFLTLHAETNGVYFRFRDTASGSTMVPSTYIVAGGTLSLQAEFAQHLPTGAFLDCRIERTVDRYLEVMREGSSDATLRVNLSSNPNG